jgi:pilus assembly protein FimV
VLRPEDSEPTWLLVVLSPVDNESMPLEAEVDSAVTELFVVLRPDDSEPTWLFVVLRPVESEPT